MFWQSVFLVLFVLCVTPLSLGVHIRYVRGQARIMVAFTAWGVGGSITLVPIHDQTGRLMLRAERGKPRPPRVRDPRGSLRVAHTIIQTVRRGNVARRVLSKAVKVRMARVGVRVSLADASHVARLTGLLRSLPSTRVFRVVAKPDFRHKGFACQFVCILDARLGTLLAGSLLAAASYLCSRAAQSGRESREKGRKRAWISIPSEP